MGRPEPGGRAEGGRRVALTTARLVLRPYRASDLAAFTELVDASLGNIRRWMPNATRELSGDLAEWLQSARDLFDRGERYPYGVFLRDGTLVGHITATPDGAGAVALGYWTHAAHLRRGYTAEAVLGVIEAFAPATFIIRCDPANAGSAGVASRAGFVHVRTDALESDGHPYQEMTWERVVPPRYT